MEAKTKLLDQYTRVLENATQDYTGNFYLIGEVLTLIFDQKLHLSREGVTTIDQFLTHLGLKRANAYHAMRVWREFGSYTLEGIPHDRLVRLLALRIPDDNKQHWLKMARDLPAYQFNDLLRQARGKPAKDSCKHLDIITKFICKCCGKVLKTTQ